MQHYVLLGFLGTGEIIAILAVILLLFGAKQIPKMARGLAESIREFRKVGREIDKDID